MHLTRLESTLLNRIQQDFPLSSDPYGDIARDIGSTAEEVYQTVLRLRGSEIIRRIGGSFAAVKVGYVSALVAARVDQDLIEGAAACAGSFPEVTHNYERQGVYNLWFTVIAANRDRLNYILNAVRRCEGVQSLHELPALRTFKIRVNFDFEKGDSKSNTAPSPEGNGAANLTLDELDRRIIARACRDLDDSSRPFLQMAIESGVSESAFLDRLNAYKRQGALRRFGAVLRHHKAGFAANGMSVWNVPDPQVDHAAGIMTACPEVSHCYERPRLPDWPYNLFGMVHARTKEECAAVVQDIAQQIGIDDNQILFSVREFKKTSMVYFASDD